MTALREEVQKLFDGGGGEAVGALRFLPLVTLESGARYGIDRDLAWIIAPGDGRPPLVFSPADGHQMHEALERRREDFDAELERSARALGLPPDDVVFAFPVFEVIRAVLAKQASYMTRLALQWLRPSELRELRREIKAVITTPNMPAPVRDLAERLVVPE